MSEIKLNGESYSFKGKNITDLLTEIEIESEKVALELNRVIIAREDFSNIILKDGDELELVEFVGGG